MAGEGQRAARLRGVHATRRTVTALDDARTMFGRRVWRGVPQPVEGILRALAAAMEVTHLNRFQLPAGVLLDDLHVARLRGRL